MARKNEQTGKAQNNGWRGFIDVSIPSETHWEEVAEQSPKGGFREILQDLVGAGLKVSLAYSAANDGYMCALTGQAESGDNMGLTMSTWASGLDRALCGAWYKHVVICGGKAWDRSGRQGLMEL